MLKYKYLIRNFSNHTKQLFPFHLAIPVHNLKEARHFYGEILGLTEGRSSDKWQDYSFYGN